MSGCHRRAIIGGHDDRTGTSGHERTAGQRATEEERMFNRLDLALRRFPGNRHGSRTHTRTAGLPSGIPVRRPALGLAPWKAGRSMPPAALRVLETTWRLWREPAA